MLLSVRPLAVTKPGEAPPSRPARRRNSRPPAAACARMPTCIRLVDTCYTHTPAIPFAALDERQAEATGAAAAMRGPRVPSTSSSSLRYREQWPAFQHANRRLLPLPMLHSAAVRLGAVNPLPLIDPPHLHKAFPPAPTAERTARRTAKELWSTQAGAHLSVLSAPHHMRRCADRA
jgi:hypothetical protein